MSKWLINLTSMATNSRQSDVTKQLEVITIKQSASRQAATHPLPTYYQPTADRICLICDPADISFLPTVTGIRTGFETGLSVSPQPIKARASHMLLSNTARILIDEIEKNIKTKLDRKIQIRDKF